MALLRIRQEAMICYPGATDFISVTLFRRQTPASAGEKKLQPLDRKRAARYNGSNDLMYKIFLPDGMRLRFCKDAVPFMI